MAVEMCIAEWNFWNMNRKVLQSLCRTSVLIGTSFMMSNSYPISCEETLDNKTKDDLWLEEKLKCGFCRIFLESACKEQVISCLPQLNIILSSLLLGQNVMMKQKQMGKLGKKSVAISSVS